MEIVHSDFCDFFLEVARVIVFFMHEFRTALNIKIIMIPNVERNNIVLFFHCFSEFWEPKSSNSLRNINKDLIAFLRFVRHFLVEFLVPTEVVIEVSIVKNFGSNVELKSFVVEIEIADCKTEHWSRNCTEEFNLSLHSFCSCFGQTNQFFARRSCVVSNNDHSLVLREIHLSIFIDCS